MWVYELVLFHHLTRMLFIYNFNQFYRCMKKKDLIKLTEYYFKSFEAQYIRMLNADSKESIHDTRVSIKRIMALINFFEELKICSKKEIKKISSAFEIFEVAGMYREYQLFLELLDVYKNKLNHKFDNVHRSLIRMLNIYKSEFQHLQGNISFIEIYKNLESIKDEINKTCDKKVSNGLKKYIESRVLYCHKYAAAPNLSKYLHEIRRTLKHLRFILEQINPYKKKDIQEIICFKDLKEVELMLGDWHDLDLFLQTILDYIERKKGSYDLTIYNQLINAIKTDQVKMEQKIKFALVPVIHVFMLLIR